MKNSKKKFSSGLP